MSKPAADVLEKVAEAGGCLLRVEREPMPGPAGGTGSTLLRLVFDVGGVDLSAGDDGALLAAESETGALPVDAAAEEPWWALMGNPLVRVQPHQGSALLVQFRADADSPKIFVVESRGGGVGISPLV